MATNKAVKQDLWEMLTEVFDTDEFKRIFRSMESDERKFRYYMDILKLLTYKNKTSGDGGSQDIDKLLDEMFKVKK